MKVDFERLHWENYPSTDTPINADNLNRLEEGVAGLYSDVSEIQEELGGGVGEYVTEWLDEHVDPVGSAVVVDDTLSIEGAAADAKKTGDEISDLKDGLSSMQTATASDVGKALKAKTVSDGKVTEWEFGVAGGGLTDTQKELIIEIMRNALYSSDQSTNIDDLEEAFNKTIVSLSATVNLGTDIVYTDNTLESLKKYLTVTATYDDQTSQIVTGYVLSGTLTVGTSVITITYKNVMTTVEIPVSQAVTRYTITNNLTDVTNSNTDTTISEGNTYIGFLSANVAGYMPSNVSVTMGNTDITSTAYDSTNYSISINSVNGDIVITAEAEEDTTLPVYTLSAPMTESGVIDYVLFNQDQDWTIEITVDTPANSGSITVSNWDGQNTYYPLRVGVNYVNGINILRMWNAYNELNMAWLDGTKAGTQKVVITHDADGDSIGYWKQTNMKDGKESYGQGYKTLQVGTTVTPNNGTISVTINSGTLSDFKIFKRILTSEEISEYVGWTVE